MDKFLKTFLSQSKTDFFYEKNLGNNSYLLSAKDDQKFVLKALIKREEYPGSNEMFQRRFLDLLSINEVNTLDPDEIGTINKQFYKLYKYREISLLEIIQNRVLSAKEAISIFENILLSLQVYHKNKIVHENLKPSNIFLEKDKIIFTDFEFEKKSKQSHYDLPSEKGVPVVYKDIYSLGIIFYEMLNWNVMNEGIVKYPHIPGNLFRLIEKACIDYEHRHFNSANEVMLFLKKAYDLPLDALKLKDIPDKQIEVDEKKNKIKLKYKSFLLYLFLYVLIGVIILYLYLK